MKTNNKVLFLLSFVVVIVITIVTSLIKTSSFNNNILNLNEMKIQLQTNSKITIQNNKLYDEINQSFLNTSNDDYLVKKGYNPIEVYDYEKYCFLVYSTDQKTLLNDMFLDVISINNDYDSTIAFIIDKNDGDGLLFHFQNVNESHRYNLANIDFIDDNAFILPRYNLTNDLPVDILRVQLINNNKYFEMLSIKLTNDIYYDLSHQIINYAHVNDIFIYSYYEYYDLEKMITKIYRYNYTYTYDENSISQSLVPNEYLFRKYQNEVNLIKGEYYVENNQLKFINNNGDIEVIS